MQNSNPRELKSDFSSGTDSDPHNRPAETCPHCGRRLSAKGEYAAPGETNVRLTCPSHGLVDPSRTVTNAIATDGGRR